MTQEEIQQKAYEVYPLDLDRHMIIEGEPYDNNKERREAYIRGLTDSKPSLPSNLDEAAFAYENKLWESGYKECGYAPQNIADAFKAGAEWMAEQGASFNTKVGWIDGPTILDWPDDILDKFEIGDEVIVQIRNK